MKHFVSVVLLGAATMLAASALAQTVTKPPAKPAPATKTAAATARPAAAHPTAHPSAVHPTIVPRRPVFVPPPPVIELDEIAVVPDLPTVLDTDARETYRRIFQAQAAGQFAQADADIARLKDKTLMGYVGAQRLLSPGHPARYEELAAWLQEYNDHPDAPAIYRLALSRRTPGSPELTPSSFVSQAPSSPSFAAARTVSGADAGRAAELRARLQGMADDGGYNAAFALLDQKSTADVLGPQEVELWRGRIRTRALEADSQNSVQLPVDVGLPPDANWNAALSGFVRGNMADSARRFEMVADAAPDRASSWTLSAGSFWAARANLLAGNPQKFAPYLKRAALHGRTFYGLIAQKALGMRIEPDWNVPALDRSRADVMRNDRVGRRALALLQLGAATAAERELFSASIDADPRYIEAILALAQKASLPSLSAKVGNANWDQRHNIKGFDGAVYPLPPWQPAGGYSVDRALLWGFMRQEFGVQSQGALLCRRHGPDAADAGHRAARRQEYLARPDGRQLLRSVDQHRARTGLYRFPAERGRQQPGAHRGWLQWRAGQRHALGQFAQRLAGSAALRRLDPAQRDARLRAARAGQLLDVPDPARPADAVARPDRRPRMAALHAAGHRALTLPAM